MNFILCIICLITHHWYLAIFFGMWSLIWYSVFTAKSSPEPEIQVKTFYGNKELENFLNKNKGKIEIISLQTTDTAFNFSKHHTITFKKKMD